MKQKQSLSPPSDRICCQCGALVPINQDLCVICGTPFSQKECVITTPSTEKSVPLSPRVQEADRRFPRVVAFIFVLILIFGSVSVGVLEYFSLTRLKKTYTSKNSLLYYQKPSTLKIQLENQKSPTLLRQDFSSSTVKDPTTLYSKDSHDQRFVAYLNNQIPYKSHVKGDLNLLDLTTLAENQPQHPGFLLAVSVVDFEFFPTENKLAYLTEEGDLFIADYSKISGVFPSEDIPVQKAASTVGAIAGISSDTILFMRGDSTHSGTLEENRKIIKTGGQISPTPFDLFTLSATLSENDSQQVASQVINILDSYGNYERIVYTTLSEPYPLAQYSVYLHASDQEEDLELVSQVSYVATANAQLGQLLYLTPNDSRLSYSDLIYDDVEQEDSILLDPIKTQRPIFPTPEEERELDSLVVAYEAKVQRDLFRRTVKGMIQQYQKDSYLSYSLKYLPAPNQPVEMVDGNIIGLQPVTELLHVNEEGTLALFNSPDSGKVHRKNMSDFTTQNIQDFMTNPQSIPIMLAETLPENLILYNIAEKNTQVLHSEQGERNIRQYVLAPNQKAVFFISSPTGESEVGTLYTWKMGPGTEDGIIYVDDMVSSIAGFTSDSSSGIVYETASRDTPPEYNLYYMDTQGIQEVDTDVSAGGLVQSVGDRETHLLYFKDYSGPSQSGALMELKAQEQRLLSLQVHQYLYLENSRFYIIEGSVLPPYTLYRLDKEKILLDEDILSYQALGGNLFPNNTQGSLQELERKA